MPETVHSNRFEPDLRTFALALYARDGVETACLTLQDAGGLDVCELLWRCWLAHHGLAPATTAASALEAIRRWQQEMTVPLRQRRRQLKPLAAEQPRLEALRDHLKRAELASELETLTRLQLLAEADDNVMPAASNDFIARLREDYRLNSATLLTALATLVDQARALTPWPETDTSGPSWPTPS